MSPNQGAAVVWLKRDIRLADQAALAAAAASGLPVVVLYCFEPSLVTAPDFSSCHLQFINESLEELDASLRNLGGSLVLRHGEAVEALAALHAELAAAGGECQDGIAQLLSHEETGTPLVMARNAAVADWARSQGAEWTEFPQTGVVRNLASRDGWAKRWTQLMVAPQAPAPARLRFAAGIRPGRLMTAAELGVAGEAKPEAMKGGESHAQRLLASFLGGRAAGYSTNMSSPNSAWEGCSRLSPYLAWGCISLRCVYQRTKAAADVLRAAKGKSKGVSQGRAAASGKGGTAAQQQQRQRGRKRKAGQREEEEEDGEGEAGSEDEEEEGADDGAAAGGEAGQAAAAAGAGAPGAAAVGLKDLAAFTARLRWRSHFMQKLEDQADLVAVNMCRAYDGARDESAPDPALFEAWCRGGTGYPLVDAVVRCLHRGGWINFRMRAMIFSFAAYHCWLHWRFTADYMATHFLDYEPGIHYCQAQMQAGTTGINAFRVYSPTKQVQDQDPQGVFIRKYVPELATVPQQYLAEPWRMPAAVQKQCGCIIGQDYPAPVVLAGAGRDNCRKLHAIKASLKAKEEAAAVYTKHGSRKRPNPSRPRKGGPASRQ